MLVKNDFLLAWLNLVEGADPTLIAAMVVMVRKAMAIFKERSADVASRKILTPMVLTTIWSRDGRGGAPETSLDLAAIVWKRGTGGATGDPSGVAVCVGMAGSVGVAPHDIILPAILSSDPRCAGVATSHTAVPVLEPRRAGGATGLAVVTVPVTRCAGVATGHIVTVPAVIFSIGAVALGGVVAVRNRCGETRLPAVI